MDVWHVGIGAAAVVEEVRVGRGTGKCRIECPVQQGKL